MKGKRDVSVFLLLAYLFAGALLAGAQPGARDSMPQTSQPPEGQEAAAQKQIKIGVLPFADATGTGSDQAGAVLSRMIQAEFTHSTDVMAYALDPGSLHPGDLDAQKAAEIGRAHGVEAVILGTVLQADSGESNKGGSTSVFGQLVGGDLRLMRATVTIQADLYRVPSGTKIDSFRITAKDSEKKFGQTAYTRLGDITSHDFSANNSALGKALQKAVEQLVKKVAADEPRILSTASHASKQP